MKGGTQKISDENKSTLRVSIKTGYINHDKLISIFLKSGDSHQEAKVIS